MISNTATKSMTCNETGWNCVNRDPISHRLRPKRVFGVLSLDYLARQFPMPEEYKQHLEPVGSIRVPISMRMPEKFKENSR